MTAVATVQIEHALFIRTTPAQVWDALTNGEQTARYYYGSPVESTWQPGAEVNYLTPTAARRWSAAAYWPSSPNIVWC